MVEGNVPLSRRQLGRIGSRAFSLARAAFGTISFGATAVLDTKWHGNGGRKSKMVYAEMAP